MNSCRVLVTKLGRTAAVAWIAASSLTALADPPAHAPAHGWRAKQAASYAGFSGRSWEQDFDISSGRCNREAIATVVGGVVGGAIASRVAEENRAVATIIGIAAGALIGNRIGDKLDDADRGCIAHALELGEAGRPVVWMNASTGISYELSPGPNRTRKEGACREYTMVAVSGRERSSKDGLACQSADGGWQIVE